jgi:hypothetical protein
MEDKRMEVTPEQIYEHFGHLIAVLEDIPAHFVFNLDEMGHQDWADRQTTNHVNWHTDQYRKNIPKFWHWFGP